MCPISNDFSFIDISHDLAISTYFLCLTGISHFFWGNYHNSPVYLHGQPSALCGEMSTSNPLKPFDGAPCFGWSWRALFCVLTRVDLPKNRGQNRLPGRTFFFSGTNAQHLSRSSRNWGGGSGRNKSGFELKGETWFTEWERGAILEKVDLKACSN